MLPHIKNNVQSFILPVKKKNPDLKQIILCRKLDFEAEKQFRIFHFYA